MLSETLAVGLGSYGIGSKIRALRTKRKLGLVQLGEHTGLSPGLLSKIERGQLFPTLPTLLKIALVFGVGLENFFIDSSERPMVAVVRKKDRLRLPDRPGEGSPSYFFESLDFPITNRKLEALSLSEIKYERSDDAGRRGEASLRCCRGCEPVASSAHPCSRTGVFGSDCSSSHNSAADGEDGALPRQSYGPNNPVGLNRSPARNIRSARVSRPECRAGFPVLQDLLDDGPRPIRPQPQRLSSCMN
jgi:transcriptional regulator with XRE-family HTH domain